MVNLLTYSSVGAIERKYTILPDKYLVDYQFSERHMSAAIRASPSEILSQVKQYDDKKDAVLNALLKIRELPSRIAGGLGVGNALKDRERFGFSDFLLLENTDTEIAYGLIGHFWKMDYGLVKVASAHAFVESGKLTMPKLVMGFSVIPADSNAYYLLTETRIHCPNSRLVLAFLPYWIAIRFFSGLIRRRILKQIKIAAES